MGAQGFIGIFLQSSPDPKFSTLKGNHSLENCWSFRLSTRGQDELFPLFGREDILGRLSQRVEALKKGYRQNVGLVGPRFTGKTFLLHHFLQKIRPDTEIIPLYVLLAETDFDDFLSRWLGALLQGFLSWKGVALPDEFQLLVKTSRQYIPKTLERMREVKKLAFQKKTALAFRQLLNLTATLSEETGKKILLIIDEFQHLDSLDLTDPFGFFGKEMMIQKDTLYLATSSEPHKSREIFNDRLSLLFGNFEVIEMGPLNYGAITAWAAERHSDIRIPDPDLRILSQLFNNQSYYFDLFFESARTCLVLSDSHEWTRETLMKVLTECLFNQRGAFNRHFEFEIQNLFRLGRRTHPYVNVLLAIANGRSKLLQISAYLGKKTMETKKLLQRLAGEGVIQKRGSFYMLPDPLFRFWLKNVYLLKDHDFQPGRGRTRAYFIARLDRELRKIEEENQRDLTARLEALFKEFRNDVVEMGQKKIKCPAFLELASRPTNGRFFPILGRTSHGRWFCQVFRDAVTEGDVAGFSEELKRFRRNIQRPVMVALGGIDLNAKLMAQEGKIQIWDLENLNTLLDLFGKQKIIL